MAMMQAPAMTAQPVSVSSTSTVLGIALEPGEKVIYFRDRGDPTTSDIVVRAILGVLLAIAIVGLFILAMAIFPKKWHVRAHVVTNRRLMVIYADGKAKEMRWEQLKKITLFRRRGVPQYFNLGTVNFTYDADIDAILKGGRAGADARPAVSHPS
jgi:hypothetical protein